ncbi:hypothetical protein EV421DRAFT_1738155 [Armillaria borealis]|uniref:Uncharacterized protein n=1 Tax=Armillaria borealis TaxID=47425 RepID=A0AA39MMA9_9AGAR|nr:hypothetical protein EV421DRAFT_1738155 [Armillaria borealis]
MQFVFQISDWEKGHAFKGNSHNILILSCRSGIAQSSTLWAKPEPLRSIQGIKWKLNILVNKFIYNALGSPLLYPNHLATTPLPFSYPEAKPKPSRTIDPFIEETDPAHRRLYEEVVN